MRDVIRENVARTLRCPIRNGDCCGEMCMAWAISWENNNEGYCSAFPATYEQEINEGWKRYGRRIMDSRKKLLDRVKQAEAERDAALADLERAQAEMKRLREVERLAKELKAGVSAPNQGSERIAGIPTDQIKGWHDEYERLLNNIRTAETNLFEALGGDGE